MSAWSRRNVARGGVALVGALIAPLLLLAPGGDPGAAETRPAALQGTWYPREPASLIRQVDDLLGEAGGPASSDHRVRAILVPHAAYRWSGETAEGFLRRITNDCLRFKPTVATTCYGMNDYRYKPYDAANAAWYRSNYTALARSLKDAGARVVVGSAGCVGKVASWVKSANGSLDQHNEHLAALRNVALEVATAEGARFADVFGPMYRAQADTWARLGTNYCIAGKDGVHPGGAGHLLMPGLHFEAA